MKKLLAITVIFSFMGLVSLGQKAISVPGVVKSSFSKDFPGVTAKWEKEGAAYEANFKKNSNTLSALYDASGHHQETEQDIKVAGLPQSVRDYIASNYKGEKIKEAAVITKAEREVNYEAEVKGMDVLFTKDGRFIKEVKD